MCWSVLGHLQHTSPDFAAGRKIAISAKYLALIFAGTITKWNEPKLQADNNRTISRTIFKTDGMGNAVKDAKGNPIVLNTVKVTQKITLPAQPITVIYRADSSGTTGNLLAAFSKIDPTNWANASVTGGTKVFASSDAKAAVLVNTLK